MYENSCYFGDVKFCTWVWAGVASFYSGPNKKKMFGTHRNTDENTQSFFYLTVPVPV
jgi:hypothetical protein